MRYSLFAIALLASTAHAQSISNPGGGGGGAPTGAAGGSLAGTYPNPSIASGVTITSPVLVTPALGTPASGVATNLTGTAAGLTAGNVTTNANLTGPVTSTGNATKTASAFTMGAADSAAPAAETVSVPNVVAGTSNTAGALFKFVDSGGTGTGASGGYEWDTHAAGSTGTSQNAAAAAMLLNSAGTLSASGVTATNGPIQATGAGAVGYISAALDVYAARYLAAGSATGTKGLIHSNTANENDLGPVDGASPAAQNFGTQNVVAGTSNTAGALWSFLDSSGTGTGASGGYSFKVHPLGGSGTSQNAASAALTISGAGLAALPLITTDATHTDSTICQDTTTHALYFGSGTVGICLGTSSARFKHDIAPLAAGLPEIMRLRPVSYRLNADHGDPSKTLYGFTAEDMAPVLPKLVGLDAEGRPNSADYMGIVPVLVRAVQQQQLEIKALEQRLVKDDLILAQYRPEPIALRQ